MRVQHERRHGKRVPLAFEVEVSGLGLNGVPYCDLAIASDVSDRGCKLRLSREVKAGDLLTIRVIQRSEVRVQQEPPFLYQAVWVEANHDGWTAGLAALEPGNPWRMKFPLEELVSE
jgi:hypothetical protein